MRFTPPCGRTVFHVSFLLLMNYRPFVVQRLRTHASLYALRSILLRAMYPPTATSPVPKKIMLTGSGTATGSTVPVISSTYKKPIRSIS